MAVDDPIGVLDTSTFIWLDRRWSQGGGEQA
jgi:hypothetical protein